MMAPPIDLLLLARGFEERDKARRLYLLSEGTLTEPSFLDAVLSRSNYLNDNKSIKFYKTERSGKEFGINTVEGMIKLAYSNIINNKKIFSKKKDKVIIFFDLDIYHDSFKNIKNLIELHKKYIIFVFTNPAIELFLLMCKKNSFEQIIQPNKDKILLNEKDPVTGRRFVHQLVIDTFGVDPKDKTANFDIFSSGIENAIMQELLYLSSKLTNPTKNLISNFGKVLQSIKNNNFDNIDYSLF